MGDTAAAIEIASSAIAAFDPRQADSQFVTGQNGGVTAQCYLALPLWHAGLADQALDRMRRAHELATSLDHPFSLAYALVHMGLIHQRRREPELALAQADAALELSREQGFAFFIAWASWIKGWALSQLGRSDEGIAIGREGLELYPSTGSEVAQTFGLGFLAESYLGAERFDEGLAVLDEALQLVERKEERLYEAELLRLQGEALASAGDSAGALLALDRAATAAERHGSPAWRLRVAISRARLDPSPAARKDLAGVYLTLSEGFDTADLVAARAMLETPAPA
jgi:tetratricopeptide (TPR) repeat protein